MREEKLMTTTTALTIIAAIIVAAIAAFLFFRQQRSKKLRYQFGPEYEHAVREYGSSTKAEDVLQARQKRMESLHVHSLQADERDRFAERWREVQSRFVDDPASSIDSADQLVNEVMEARGYPMSEFDRRAEDLSVDHPHVVRNYRAAHAVALRRDRGEASTEDLRQALVYYRDLFDELLEAHVAGRWNK
jgi:ABC-type nickel/cobalt efflux system permease component RcnA